MAPTLAGVTKAIVRNYPMSDLEIAREAFSRMGVQLTTIRGRYMIYLVLANVSEANFLAHKETYKYLVFNLEGKIRVF